LGKGKAFLQANSICSIEYSIEQIELACKKALPFPNPSYHIIQNILKNRVENEPDLFSDHETFITTLHENVRGPEAYF
jgi:hypothetical protein